MNTNAGLGFDEFNAIPWLSHSPGPAILYTCDGAALLLLRENIRYHTQHGAALHPMADDMKADSTNVYHSLLPWVSIHCDADALGRRSLIHPIAEALCNPEPSTDLQEGKSVNTSPILRAPYHNNAAFVQGHQARSQGEVVTKQDLENDDSHRTDGRRAHAPPARCPRAPSVLDAYPSIAAITAYVDDRNEGAENFTSSGIGYAGLDEIELSCGVVS